MDVFRNFAVMSLSGHMDVAADAGETGQGFAGCGVEMTAMRRQRRNGMVGRVVARWLLGVTIGLGGCGKAGETEGDIATPSKTETATEAIAVREKGVEGLMIAGDLEAALVKAREATVASPRDAQAFFGLASAAMATGRLDEALDAVRAGLRLDPERAGGYVLRGLVHKGRGDTAEAERSWTEALGRNPRADEARAARMQLAGLARERGDLHGEAAVLKAALEADPGDAAVRGQLALCLAGLGDVAAARTEALEAAKRDPRAGGVQRLLAALAWDAGDYRGALERAIIALRVDEGDAVAERLMEGAFYIEAGARLVCEAGLARGERGWPAEAVGRVLEGMEKEFGFEGAGVFVELDKRFGEDDEVQGRVRGAAAVRCPK